MSIYRASEGRVYIINELGANEGGLGPADLAYFFGNPGDNPYVGDFDDDGIDEVGLHRESTGLVYFRFTHTEGVADHSFIFGDPGDKIMAADFPAVAPPGPDTVGLFRPSTCTIYLRYTNTQGVADETLSYGVPTGLPVAGEFGPLPGGGTPPPGCPPPPAPPPGPTTTTTTTTTLPTTTTTTPTGNCDPAYPTVCIPPPPPDLNCPDITHRNFTVLEPDPHNFDTDGVGIGCEE